MIEAISIGWIGPFSRLIKAQRELTQLLERLRILHSRMDGARRYLGLMSHKPLLAHTYLERTESERSRALVRLRVVRAEIYEILRLDWQAAIPRLIWRKNAGLNGPLVPTSTRPRFLWKRRRTIRHLAEGRFIRLP